VARINTASQRTDLLPWAFAHDALLAPVIGACAVVLAPPADHPVFALRATTATEPWGAKPCPPKQRVRAHDARSAVRANDRSRLRQWSQAFKFFFTRFERA
jgi:hypothetical protein